MLTYSNKKTYSNMKRRRTTMNVFTCPICFDSKQFSVILCKNGHEICVECSLQLIQDKEVDYFFDTKTNLPKATVVDFNTIDITCVICRVKCHVLDIFSSSKKSKSNISKKCYFSPCTFSGNCDTLKSHVIDCKYRNIKCKYCGSFVRPKKMAQHIENYCKSQPCRFCRPTTSFPRKKLIHHMQLHGGFQNFGNNVENLILDSSSHINMDDLYPIEQGNVPVNNVILMNALYMNYICKQFLSNRDLSKFLNVELDDLINYAEERDEL